MHLQQPHLTVHLGSVSNCHGWCCWSKEEHNIITTHTQELIATHRSTLQSDAMWPPPPQRAQMMFDVIFCCSGHSHVLWAADPQLRHLQNSPSSLAEHSHCHTHLSTSSGLKVPLSSANWSICWRLRSLSLPGTSIPDWIMFLIYRGVITINRQYQPLTSVRTLSTATLTSSGLVAVIRAWSGSSSPGWGSPNRLNLPSLLAPLPLIMILQLVCSEHNL